MKIPFQRLVRSGLWLALVAGLLTAGVPIAAAVTVDTLVCEYRTNPLGIDAAAPRLSWIPRSSQRGETISAYQIQVASSAAILATNVGDLWDSGKVLSSENAQNFYAGKPLTSWQQIFWQVRLWNGAGVASPWSSPATWTAGVMKTADWSAQWITPSTAATDVGSTLLRHNFTTKPGLVRAVISAAGLGQYEMSFNGARVGTDVISQGWTLYNKTVTYDTYDVTSLLQSGNNTVAFWLGNGMYNIPGNSGRYTKITQSFGPRQAYAQLHLVYSDGSVQTVATAADGTWKWSAGPVTFNTTYGGEDYDARLEQAGWNQPTFNDAAWTAVSTTTGPGGVLRGTSSGAPPIRVQQTFNVVTPALSPTTASVVYDFGQNAAQWPTLTVHGSAGATVTLTPSELGTPGVSGSISPIVSPVYYTYTLKGSPASVPETFTPRFCAVGYRYLQVALSGTVSVDGLTSSAVSGASTAAGTFTCSNTLFNQTYQMIRWAQQNNVMSIFTDCPGREKLGWIEQIYLNGPSLRYNFDLSANYTKAMQDMADSQTSNGVIPTTAPDYLGSGGDFGDTPEWDSSFIFSAWQQYEFTGDTRILSQYYAAMKTLVAYLGTRASGNIVAYGLGDWYDLGPGGLGYSQLTPDGLTATATYYRDAWTVAQIAQVLGNSADYSTYSTLAANISASFNAKYYNSGTGNYATGSQTANAMPLKLGLVASTNTSQVVANLVQSIQTNGNAMTSGDIGMGYLLPALCDNGRADVAFNMHNRTNSPGYGYILSRGATSMTEGWDGSNSQDHFFLGEITEWFFRYLAGIQPDITGPGFKKIIIKPSVVGDLTSVSATYNSVRGPISSAWTLTPGSGTQMSLAVTVPVGTTASVYLPLLATNTSTLGISESGTPIMQNGAATGSVAGVSFLAFTTGNAGQQYAGWSVGSGTYQFTWQITLLPTGLSATGAGGQITLNWTVMPGASSYNLKRSTVSGGPYQVLASGVTGTSFVDTGLTDGAPYYYVFSAIVNGAESINSVEAQATPSANLGFEAPVISTYQYNPPGGSWTFVPLSGVNGSGITGNGSGFTSSNSNAPEGKQVAFLQGTGTITQAISGFLPGANYSLRFLAAQRASYNGGGQTWQVKLDNTVIGTYAPAESASSYATYTAAFTATAMTHTLSFVGTDTHGGDNTIFLDNVGFQITAPPAAPTGLTAKAGVQQVSLTWNTTPGTASYGIQRATGSGSFVTLAATPATPALTDTGLVDGTTYSYSVFAVNSAGASGPSNVVTATPQAPPVTASELVTPIMIYSGQTGTANFSLAVSVTGHAYQLQSTNDLVSGKWQNVPGSAAVQSGNGGPLQFSVPVAPSVLTCFFRFLISPQ
jgi:alpha-L-rhamnosidase